MDWNKSIFLAHATEDKDFVRSLHKKLRKQGLNPWLDEENLKPGVKWEDKIREAIKSCRFFIACLSKNSVAKNGFLQKELRIALDELENRPSGTVYFIPVLLDNIELPDITVGTIRLKDYHAAKLYENGDLGRLIDHLNSLNKINPGTFGGLLSTKGNRGKSRFNLVYLLFPLLLFLIGLLFANHKFDQSETGLISVSANKLWVNTGIVLKPGESVRITASGLVNMALHRVMQAADLDERPKFGWNDPKGLDYMPEGPLYRRRRELLVYPQAKYGSLLFHASLEGDIDPSKEYPSPSNIYAVKDGLTYMHPKNSNKNAVIFLTCNDTVLKKEEKFKNSFVGTQEEVNETYGFIRDDNNNLVPRYRVEDLEKRWDRLIDERYWEIWFDDNGGSFLVEIEFI